MHKLARAIDLYCCACVRVYACARAHTGMFSRLISNPLESSPRCFVDAIYLERWIHRSIGYLYYFFPLLDDTGRATCMAILRESEDFVNHIYNEEPSRTYIRRVYERIVRENNVLVKMISVRLVIVLCTIHIDISDDRFYCIRIKIKSNRSVRCFFFPKNLCGKFYI